MLFHISRSRKKNCLCIGRRSVIQLWGTGCLVSGSLGSGGGLVVLETVPDLISVDEGAAEQHEARHEDARADQGDQTGQEPAAWTRLARLDSSSTSLLGLLSLPAVDGAVTEEVPPHTGPGPGLAARRPPDVRGVAGPPQRGHHQPQTPPGLGVAGAGQPEPDVHLVVLSLEVGPAGPAL